MCVSDSEEKMVFLTDWLKPFGYKKLKHTGTKNLSGIFSRIVKTCGLLVGHMTYERVLIECYLSRMTMSRLPFGSWNKQT